MMQGIIHAGGNRPRMQNRGAVCDVRSDTLRKAVHCTYFSQASFSLGVVGALPEVDTSPETVSMNSLLQPKTATPFVQSRTPCGLARLVRQQRLICCGKLEAQTQTVRNLSELTWTHAHVYTRLYVPRRLRHNLILPETQAKTRPGVCNLSQQVKCTPHPAASNAADAAMATSINKASSDEASVHCRSVAAAGQAAGRPARAAR